MLNEGALDLESDSAASRTAVAPGAGEDALAARSGRASTRPGTAQPALARLGSEMWRG